MSEPEVQPERIPLHNDNPSARKRRLISGLFAVVLFAAAAGGFAGLIGDKGAGLIAAAMVGLPLLYIVLHGVRRQLWLEDGALVMRTWGSRRIEVARAKRIDVVLTEVRGTRTVALLVVAEGRGKSAKVDLAIYTGGGGRELGVLSLRKLADALANNIDANGLVFSELLVAQLRSEARGDGLEDRPLYRLASSAPKGKLAQRFTMDAVSRFVASLD